MIPVCEGFAIRQSHGLQRIPLTKRGEIIHRPSFPCYFVRPGCPAPCPSSLRLRSSLTSWMMRLAMTHSTPPIGHGSQNLSLIHI